MFSSAPMTADSHLERFWTATEYSDIYAKDGMGWILCNVDFRMKPADTSATYSITVCLDCVDQVHMYESYVYQWTVTLMHRTSIITIVIFWNR